MLTAPAKATAGRPFKVKVVSTPDASAAAKPLAGRRASGRRRRGRPTSQGSRHRDRRARPASCRWSASKPGDIRSAPRRSSSPSSLDVPRRVRTALAAVAVASAARRVRSRARAPAPDVNVTVTRGLRDPVVARSTRSGFRVAETVMRLLERSFKVQQPLRRRLRRVDQRPLGHPDRELDWFYYVNGVQARQGRGDDGRAQGRPDLVGPARLDRRPIRSRPSSARSRSRSPRRRRQALADDVECATAMSTPRARRSPRRCVVQGPGLQGSSGYGSGNDSLGRRGRDLEARSTGEVAAELIDARPVAPAGSTRGSSVTARSLSCSTPTGKVATTLGRRRWCSIAATAPAAPRGPDLADHRHRRGRRRGRRHGADARRRCTTSSRWPSTAAPTTRYRCQEDRRDLPPPLQPAACRPSRGGVRATAWRWRSRR